MTAILALTKVDIDTFPAVGDGVADDTTAIQNALNDAPNGGTVFLPPGTFGISSSLVIPPGVRLQGSYGVGGTGTGSKLKVLASWASTNVAAIRLKDKEEGGYSVTTQGAAICDIQIDGSAYTATAVAGIRATGNIVDLILSRVSIRMMSGAGIEAVSYTRLDSSIVFPVAWMVSDVKTFQCTGNGFTLNRCTDSTWYNTKALGCGGDGFVLTNTQNSRFVACQAEWSGLNGFHITGSWDNLQGSGGVLFAGCTTDRNNRNGVLIDSTNGFAALLFSGLSCRRDGSNSNAGGGGYAGLNIGATNHPVLAVGMSCYPGVNDDGTGTNSPQYGVAATGASQVHVIGGYIHAATTAVNDGGGNTSFDRNLVTTATGTTASPTVTPAGLAIDVASQLNIGGSGSTASVAIKRALGADTIFSARVGAEGFSRLASDASGNFSWSSGSAAADVSLGRSAANKLSLTTADLRIATAGRGLMVAEGSNAKMGTATLVGGTVTVSTTAVTASSRILLTTQSLGTVTAPKAIAVTARTAGTSFTITSADATDTSVIAWMMVEPS